MTDLRTAAQQALEALEEIADDVFSPYDNKLGDAILALRAALAQQAEPVQEPVAWLYEEGADSTLHWNKPPLYGTPLYTAPPKRKPLTEEEIDNICRQAHGGQDPQEWARNFARAIERAHGIGEQL